MQWLHKEYGVRCGIERMMLSVVEQWTQLWTRLYVLRARHLLSPFTCCPIPHVEFQLPAATSYSLNSIIRSPMACAFWTELR
jgi:hypothetical protein